MRPNVVEIRAAIADSPEHFLESAREHLGVWGGMSNSVSRDSELMYSVSFDPSTVEGGLEALFLWLDDLDVEYTATFSAWGEES